MSLALIPLTVYGILREPLTLLKFTKLALKGFNLNKDSFYNNYKGGKNEILFYVGLHNDEHIYFLSNLAGSDGKLVVFTSTKKSYDQLNNLKNILGLKNIETVPITFSIESNEMIFAAQPAIKEIINSATLIDSKQRKSYKKIEISYNETLDNYCLSYNIRPQLLEIKLPWHELAVLKGAKKILKKYKPRIVIECDVRFSSRPKILEIFEFLTNIEYRGYFILDNVQIPVNNFDFDTYQNPKSDFYCKEFIFE